MQIDNTNDLNACNYKMFLYTVRSLASSQGFYSRLQNEIDSWDEDNMGDNYTIDNWNMATSYETMKWFRSIGSRQRIKVRVNSKGKYIRDIYSYAPHDNDYRNLIRFTEL